MLKDIMLKKVFYVLAILFISLLSMNYLPAELVLIISLIIFIFMSGYLHPTPVLIATNDAQYDEKTVLSLRNLAKENLRSLEISRHDLTALISTQKSAIGTLMDAFVVIQTLLNKQKSQLYSRHRMQDKENAIFPFIENTANSFTHFVGIATKMNNDLLNLHEKVDDLCAQIPRVIQILQEVELVDLRTDLLVLQDSIKEAGVEDIRQHFASTLTELQLLSHQTSESSIEMQEQLSSVNVLVNDLSEDLKGSHLNTSDSAHHSENDVTEIGAEKAESDLQLMLLTTELLKASHSAMRGLQFGDITVQSMQFILDGMAHMSDLMHQVSHIKGTEIAEEINVVVQEFQHQKQQRMNNPVSSSDMSSGEAELF